MKLTAALLTMLCTPLLLCACGAPKLPSLVTQPTTATPMPQEKYASQNGSLYPGARFQSYFKDDLPTQRGDSLTILIQEASNASLSEETRGSRRTSLGNDIDATLNSPFFSTHPEKNTLHGGFGASGKAQIDGRGSRKNSSDFKSALSVTVIDTLPNGNLRVAGEKQMRINGDEELIRLSGTVHPRDILPGNLVLSTKLTDVRLEQQTAGNNPLFAKPGWLTRFFMNVLPF